MRPHCSRASLEASCRLIQKTRFGSREGIPMKGWRLSRKAVEAQVGARHSHSFSRLAAHRDRLWSVWKTAGDGPRALVILLPVSAWEAERWAFIRLPGYLAQGRNWAPQAHGVGTEKVEDDTQNTVTSETEAEDTRGRHRLRQAGRHRSGAGAGTDASTARGPSTGWEHPAAVPETSVSLQGKMQSPG